MRLFKYAMSTAVALVFMQSALIADLYEAPWFTIDCGGVTPSGASLGDGFALAGTIGQSDAGYMTGGSFEVIGGFWQSAAPTSTCVCPGDMNGDGRRDGVDIQGFVDCLANDGSCTCADADGVNGVTLADVMQFVDDLLLDVPCP